MPSDPNLSRFGASSIPLFVNGPSRIALQGRPDNNTFPWQHLNLALHFVCEFSEAVCGLWIPVATRTTGPWVTTATEITGHNEKARAYCRQLFRVEGKCVLRQVGNGLATKKPIGPCQSVARETRNPLLTSPSSLLRLLPSTIVKQRCARERGANPWKPICGATFSS